MNLEIEDGQIRAVGYIKTGCLDIAAAALQRELIIQYAKERDWDLIEIYEDTGLLHSGMNNLLEDSKRKEFNIVLTDKVRNFLCKDEYLELFAQGISLYFTRPGQGLVPGKRTVFSK